MNFILSLLKIIMVMGCLVIVPVGCFELNTEEHNNFMLIIITSILWVQFENKAIK